MTTTLTICDTCKRADWREGDEKTDGERLAEFAAAAEARPDVIVRRHSCLMGCGKGCNVAIQAHGKLTYVLGQFTPEEESAAAILDYAAAHAQSTTGRVLFRDWPQGVKGHFVARLPVLAPEEP